MKDVEGDISSKYSKALKNDNSVVSNTGKAKFANYSESDLENMPDHIDEYSFGCGNPLAFSDVRDGQTVLDLGCGAGLDLLLAVERVGPKGKVIGVDINDDMLEIARTRISKINNIELRKGTIERLPVDSGTIDWVISNCVINLSNNKQKVFEEISRVLKPGGNMLVSDIVADHVPWWVRRSGVLHAACAGGVISEKQYLEGLTHAGMHDCKVVARHHYEVSQLVAVVYNMVPKILRKISCCGQSVLYSILTKLALPISKSLWSAKISATNTKV